MDWVHNKKIEQYLCFKVDTTTAFNVEVVKGQQTKCSVSGCDGRGTNKFTLYCHFTFQHPRTFLVITGDGLLERCPTCNMFTWTPDKHPESTTCKQIKVFWANKILQDKQVVAGDVVFYIGGSPIERFWTFKYLGWVLEDSNDDTACIDAQVKKACH